MNHLFAVFICLFNLINPLLCLEWSYSNVRGLQEVGPLRYLHHKLFVDAIPDHSKQHLLTKRQDLGTPEDEAYCIARITDADCSTGSRQAVIDARLTCGMVRIEEATRLANGCARNERGQYCSSALTLFNVNGNEMKNIEGNCSGVLVSNFCPTACRILLEDFRGRLGCCVNTLVNNSRTVSVPASVDYRVWNICDVPLPAADCEDRPVTVNPPDNEQQCIGRQYFHMKYTQNLCLPERGQPYINAIVLDRRCNDTSFFISAEYVTNLCSMDDSGRICGLTYGVDTDVDLDTLNSVCATSNISCTSGCRDDIRNAKELRGCCLNWINFSSYPTETALSYGVWKSCGIETPGFCESPLSLSGTAVKENHVALLTIISGLICQYIYGSIITG